MVVKAGHVKILMSARMTSVTGATNARMASINLSAFAVMVGKEVASMQPVKTWMSVLALAVVTVESVVNRLVLVLIPASAHLVTNTAVAKNLRTAQQLMTVSKWCVVANRAAWTKTKATGVNVHPDGTVEDSMPYAQRLMSART